MAGYGKAKAGNTSEGDGANWVSPVPYSPSPPLLSVFACTAITALFYIFQAQMPCSSPVSFLSVSCSCPRCFPLLVPSFSPAITHLKCCNKRQYHPSPQFFFLSLMRLRRRRCILSCSSRQKVDEDDIFWTQRKGDDKLAWSQNLAQITSDLVQCFSNAMVGSRSWIGGIFNNRLFGGGKSPDNTLNPVQEARLQKLQERMNMPFDETRLDHQASLLALWRIAFPNVPLSGFISEQWKDMGWQGCNPSTDFRGCGFISLENLLYFARTYQTCFFRLLFKKGGKRAAWEYPFAVAGINISFMLIQMLDMSTGKPKGRPGINFLRILGEDENAFDILYCVAFAMMDAQWLAMEASYMEFNDVLRTTRIQLERELCLEDVKKISDIPAYNLLYR